MWGGGALNCGDGGGGMVLVFTRAGVLCGSEPLEMLLTPFLARADRSWIVVLSCNACGRRGSRVPRIEGEEVDKICRPSVCDHPGLVRKAGNSWAGDTT